MTPDMLQIAILREAYRQKTLSPKDVALEMLRRIDAYDDPAVWICRVKDADVFARAHELEEDAGALERLPLYGVPFAVKDNIDVAGLPTTAACPSFAYTPEVHATVVARLLAAGAMLIGKTNLDQFATGLNGTRSPYGAPRCVFDNRYISGGSSSGSAVAVAAGLVAFSLGTDTAGSGRVPAAFNNLVGVKPTKGLISTAGVTPACRSLDCVSLFAASAADAQAVAEIAQGFDASDDYSRQGPAVRLPLEKFRFGVLAVEQREFFGDEEAGALYEAAIGRLGALGGQAVAFDYAPFRDAAALLYEDAFVAERLAGIEAFFAAQAQDMDPNVRAIIRKGQNFSAADAFKAAYKLRAFARKAEGEWAKFDFMLLPTAPTIFTVAQMAEDPIGNNSRLGLYTNFVNLLDYAAVAVPAGFRPASKLPFGVTLIGPAFSDSDLLVLADRLHRALGQGVGRAVGEGAEIPAAALLPVPAEAIQVVVAGAHMSGLQLNHELTGLSGRLVETTRTAPFYRLMALPGTVPPKPGLVRTPGFAGPGIEVEIWSLSPENFGRFIAGVPAPMGIGKVTLASGAVVPGFLCEAFALEGAADVTGFGGWRAYLASK
ncbi:allophanate hydrolase [Methylocella silvestris BL2]|uniref:Allophanate hydrolase n=1 Tax=Methylocella silvestris (strain DSM 15510 / CIP 108128 / LMG 27833 / NCIMB 13906 / BL2) TaxID=395965 RepID=B8EQ40_METSB|nr:allophanate hydrolase [Methylocella silvestris]ACK51530.1 allophanate hydrolase [Methylocella silvestris BL2]